MRKKRKRLFGDVYISYGFDLDTGSLFTISIIENMSYSVVSYFRISIFFFEIDIYPGN